MPPSRIKHVGWPITLMIEEKDSIKEASPTGEKFFGWDPGANKFVSTLSEQEITKAVSEVNTKFTRVREERRPFETTWFISAAFSRGMQNFNPHPIYRNRVLSDQDEPITKRPVMVNRIFPKSRARFAKFTKSRPQPIVIPFSTERKDKLDARATQKALDYQWEKQKLEIKYRKALLWAKDCSKGFWEISWDPHVIRPVSNTNELGEKVITDAEVGDVVVTCISPFEIFPLNLKESELGEQDEIIHACSRDVKDVETRHPHVVGKIQPETSQTDAFQYERQIANLNARAYGVTSSLEDMNRAGDPTHILVKELFTKPSARFPKGRYVVVAGEQLCKYQEELPNGFADMPNPYPFVEFVDVPTVGQFWGTTVVEQLVPIQRAYNQLRARLDRHLHKMVHPKWLVPKQAQIPEGALTNDADEVVEFNYIPGMPEPHTNTAPVISGDVWRGLQVLKEEIDDVSQVYPSSEGRVGGEKSGFHASLLQEAVDEILQPEARGHELAIEDASLKIRRLMKMGYSVDRLISVVGRNRQPDVFEFSKDNIDEHAAIRVQVGSGLSQFKATRITQILELYDKGMFGPQQDPEVNRKVLSLLDLGGLEEAQEAAASHEELANVENDEIVEGNEIPIPQFYENHMIHYNTHTSFLSSTEARDLPEDRKLRLISHTLIHFKFINPVAAFNLAMEYGLTDLIQQGLIPPPPPLMPQGPPEATPPQGPPPPPGVGAPPSAPTPQGAQ